MMIYKLVKNQKGSMIVNAIATSVIVAILSGVILQQSLTSVKTIRSPRVKAAMTLVEGRLRTALWQPNTYTGCDTDNTGGAAGAFSDCTIAGGIDPFVAGLAEPVVGCGQAGPGICGVVITGAVFNPGGNRRFTGTITYQGNEIGIRPLPIDIEVPREALTMSRILCPPTGQPERFLFKGFNNDGTKKCEAPVVTGAAGASELNGCPDNYYMKSFNPATLAVECELVTNAAVPTPACAANQMIDSISYVGNTFNSSCVVRPPPSTPGIDYIQPTGFLSAGGLPPAAPPPPAVGTWQMVGFLGWWWDGQPSPVHVGATLTTPCTDGANPVQPVMVTCPATPCPTLGEDIYPSTSVNCFTESPSVIRDMFQAVYNCKCM
jgi:hypothetical protein